MNVNKFKVYRCVRCGHWPDEHSSQGCDSCELAGFEEQQIQHNYEADPHDGVLQIPPGVHVLDDGVHIYDQDGEIASWNVAELCRDPSVALAMANAVKLYYAHGAYALRRRLKRETSPYAALRWHGGMGNSDFNDDSEGALSKKEAIAEAFKGFFYEHPEVKAVTWEHNLQGDDEFGVNIARYDGGSMCWHDGSYNLVDGELFTETHETDAECFAAMLAECRDVFRDVFGESTAGEARPDGYLKAEEY